MYCATARRRLKQRRSARFWIVIGAAVPSLLYLFYVFALPQLLRLNFRGGLSWYDLGAYGFGPSKSYISFDGEPPLVEITKPEGGAGCDTRYTFLAPHGDSIAQPGPIILDAHGELVWMKHNWETTQDFNVQRYRGEDYLTYWEGSQVEGRGFGSWYMLDSTYTPRYVINPVGNYGGDLHEFHITANETALATIYDPILTDLSSIGGSETGWIYDCLFQEIDIATGDLIFEWRASEHFPINGTYHTLIAPAGTERASAFDFFHINSVDKDAQGNYIISSRNFHMVCCISRHTGEILWTLGGKTNDFQDLSDGEATNFAWQHHARWHVDSSTLTLFNNAALSHDELDESRGMVIYLDIPKREAMLRGAYYHPYHVTSVSQGSVQVLDDNGCVLVAWGHSAAFSEFNADGQLECNVHFGASAFFDFGRVVSYRVFKADWVGNPQSSPDAVVTGNVVHVSWNGATEVASWQVQTWDLDPHNSNLDEVDLTKDAIVIDAFAKTGFETKISIHPSLASPIFRLAALDKQGNVLGVTDPLQIDVKALPSDEVPGVIYWIVGAALVAGICGLLAAFYRIYSSRRGQPQGPWLRSAYQLIPLRERGQTEPR